MIMLQCDKNEKFEFVLFELIDSMEIFFGDNCAVG